MSVKNVFDSAIRLAEEKQALQKQIEDLQAEVKELKRQKTALKKKNKSYEKALRHVQETLGELNTVSTQSPKFIYGVSRNQN